MSSKRKDTFSEVIVGLFMLAVLALLVYFTIVISGVDVLQGRRKVEATVAFKDVGGLKETVGDTGTGIVAPECTPQAIMHEIVRFFANPHLKQSFIMNIRKEKERLSWKSFSEQLIDFINQIKK